jgi:hypothetical protein
MTTDFMKVAELERVEKYIKDFSDFLSETNWPERSNIKFQTYMEKQVDPNLEVFVAIQKQGELP